MVLVLLGLVIFSVLMGRNLSSYVKENLVVHGDTFSIARNSNGVSDNRNALLLGKLQTQNTMAGGKATYQGSYSQLVSDAGIALGEIVTGLLYVDSSAQDLHRYLNTVETPLNQLGVAELCPGSEALEALNDSLRRGF